jgi:hypothetical protein
VYLALSPGSMVLDANKYPKKFKENAGQAVTQAVKIT